MKLINVATLAKKLCTTVQTIYSWKSSQKIPKSCVVKVHGKLLFDEEEIDKWLASLQKGALPATL